MNGAPRERPAGRPSAPGVVAVAAGGVVGAAVREAVEQGVTFPAGGLPAATLAINLVGAFVLGVLLEALVRAGDDTGARRGLRLVAGTGFCGAFTTYSTFALEADQLARHHHVGVAVLYVALTVVGGVVTAVAGMAAGAAGHRRAAAARAPIDPDLES